VRSAIGVMCVLLAACVVTAAGAAHPARVAATVKNCGTLSVGPGGTEHGTTAGARCLLRAYQQQCQAAVYTLSSFGVDTVATQRFRVAHASGHCVVDVTVSFRVVPQPAHQQTGVCRTLALKATHVVAARCTGEIPASIVLDPHPQNP
jgi:hypothetical protein